MIKDKIAIVTGGTSGIGKAIAKLFCAQGAKVTLFGRNAERGQAVVQELAQAGGEAQFYSIDVANTLQAEEGIKKVLDLHGKIDILVNNAGITRDALLMRMTEEQWDDVLDTNLKSAYNTCRAAIRPMMKMRQGSIINLSSVVGLTGNPGQTHYAASKSGLIGFSKSLAREVASRGIRINCVAPGFVDTSMTAVLTQEQKEALLRAIPLGRMGEPEEIAFAVLFLASDWAKYITGQVLTVDGGMVMS